MSEEMSEERAKNQTQNLVYICGSHFWESLDDRESGDGSIGKCPCCSAGLPVLASLVCDRYNNFNRFVEMAENEQEKEITFDETNKELLAILDITPGDWTALRLQGELYMIMERHNEAVECFQRAFNANRSFAQINEISKSGSISGDRQQKNLIRLLESDPGTFFLTDNVDWKAVEAKASYNDLNHCVLLSSALAKGGRSIDEAKEILDIVEGITERAVRGPEEKQELTYDILLARAECSIQAGEWDKGKLLVERATMRRQCQAGLGKLYARCLLGEGKRKSAIRFKKMGMAYFYEEPWREDRKRANLAFWRELQNEET
jgi:tetratricopeptide (TPR) repeat protein